MKRERVKLRGVARPQTDKLSSCMTKFNRSPRTNPYTTITPDTPLAELESFLKDNVFALSTPPFFWSTGKFTDSPH
jgi:hypothetical protein